MSKPIGFAAEMRRQNATQIRQHTVLEDFPLFCPKCKYAPVVRYRNRRLEEIKTPDA